MDNSTSQPLKIRKMVKRLETRAVHENKSSVFVLGVIVTCGNDVQ